MAEKRVQYSDKKMIDLFTNIFKNTRIAFIIIQILFVRMYRLFHRGSLV